MKDIYNAKKIRYFLISIYTRQIQWKIKIPRVLIQIIIGYCLRLADQIRADIQYFLPHYSDANICRAACVAGHYDLAICYFNPRYFPEACRGGNIEIVKYFFCKGVEHNQLMRGISEAYTVGHIEIIKFLAQNPKLHENNIEVPAQKGRLDIIELFDCKKKFDTIISRACSGGHIAIVEYVLKQGYDSVDFGLMCACMYNRVDIAKLFIKHGASAFDSGLENALYYNKYLTAKLMVEQGAENIYSLLYEACRFRGRKMFVDLLIPHVFGICPYCGTDHKK